MQRNKPVLWFLPILFGLTTVGAMAQIQELATTRDGSQLVFSTPFRLKGTTQFSSFKIFNFSNGSYSLIAQTAPFVSLPNGTREQDDFHVPNVSGDGKIVAWDEVVECTFVTGFCKPNVENSQTTRGFVSGAELPAEMKTGSLRVSHNGRYFLRFCCLNTGDPQSLLFYDSLTGVLTPISGYIERFNGLQQMADDGTLFLVSLQSGANVLWKNGNAREILTQDLRHPVPYPFNLETPRLSASASTLVYQKTDGVTGHVALIAQDLNSGTEAQLAAGPFYFTGGGFVPNPIGVYFLPSVSDDGHRALFRLTDSANILQTFVSNTDGTGLRQLTSDAAGIAEVVLSGDGHVGYAVTQTRALLKINVDTGDVERLLPNMPIPFGAPSIPVPGSRLFVYGDQLTTAAGGSLVSLAGVPAPLISAKSLQVTLQAPWDLDLNNPLTVVMAAPDSPFESAVPIQPAPVAPLILDVRSSDFKTELSNPGAAKPGDIIAVAITGLGPVSAPVSTGEPAPIDRFSYVTSPFSCSWGSLGPGDILFAGLMPTTVGLYQLNLRVPSVIPDSLQQASFTCTIELAGRVASTTGYVYLTR
jgi:uncharacterized protein (TIGR03437 family)